MSTDTVDIDVVLRESEALLDRLHSNIPAKEGGSEMHDNCSLPSVSSAPYQQEDYLASVVGPVIHTSPDNVVASESGRNASHTTVDSQIGPSKWEKVSSASRGDDDYVPMVDYTREITIKAVSPYELQSNPSKRSRLETYRAQSRKRRKRHQKIVVALTLVLFCVGWAWRKRAEPTSLIHSSNTTNTTESEIDSWQPNDRNVETLENDLQSCEPNYDEEFARFLHEGYIAAVQVLELEAIVGNVDERLESEITSKHPNCKNIFARIFSKRCRVLAKKRKKVQDTKHRSEYADF